LRVLFSQQRHRRGQRIEAIAQGRIETCPGARQEQRPRAPLKQFYTAGFFQLPYLMANGRRSDAELIRGSREAVMPGGGLKSMERAKGRKLPHAISVDEISSSNT
jgi:hypothetical protein